jgi:hypothetical protein
MSRDNDSPLFENAALKLRSCSKHPGVIDITGKFRPKGKQIASADDQIEDSSQLKSPAIRLDQMAAASFVGNDGYRPTHLHTLNILPALSLPIYADRRPG